MVRNQQVIKTNSAAVICQPFKAQWSLYVPHGGHYMYRTVVTICTARWSLYVPHSGHYMYRTVVTICKASLTFTNSTFVPHSVLICLAWIWEQTAIISVYNINWLVFIPETDCVYCAVRTESLRVLWGSQNKQRLFLSTTLTDWFLYPRRRVFTVRYGLNNYVFCEDLRTNSDYFPIQH